MHYRHLAFSTVLQQLVMLTAPGPKEGEEVCVCVQ